MVSITTNCGGARVALGALYDLQTVHFREHQHQVGRFAPDRFLRREPAPGRQHHKIRGLTEQDLPQVMMQALGTRTGMGERAALHPLEPVRHNEDPANVLTGNHLSLTSSNEYQKHTF